MKSLCFFVLLITGLLSISNDCEVPFTCDVDFISPEEKLNYRESFQSYPHSNSIIFSVDRNSLPKPRPLNLKQRPGYRYFWNFDDGNFLLTEKYDASVLHTFQQAGNFNVYVEASATKTDDDDVYRNIMPVSIDATLTSRRTNSYWKVKEDKAIEILDTRNPKVGKPITYIIGYVNRCTDTQSGKVYVEYDTNNYDPSQKYVYYDDVFSNDSLNANKRILTFDFNNLKPNEQRNLFVELIVKDDTDGNKAQITAKIEGACSNDDAVICKTVGEPDDPNEKYWDFMGNDLCEDSINVEIGIKFQNQGNGPTNYVRVDDIFGEKIEVNWIEWGGNRIKPNPNGIPFIGNSLKGDRGNVKLFPKNADSRHIAEFNFNNMRLRGEKEPGYGTQFQEIDTKDSIQFTANISVIRPPDCGFIKNNIEIFFDTQPPVKDTVYQCYNCKDDCGINKLVNVSLFPDNVICIEEGSTIDLEPDLSSIGFTADTFFWNNELPETQNVSISPTETTLYHFCAMACINDTNHIASDKVIVKVEKCSLDDAVFDCTITDPSCEAAADGTIQITANDALNFKWEGTTDNTNEQTNLVSGEYFVSISDENDCTLEKSLLLSEPIPIFIDYYFDVNCDENNEENCSIITRVSGGTGDYTYNWSTGDTTPNIENPPAGQIALVVTDNNSCEERKLFIQVL